MEGIASTLPAQGSLSRSGIAGNLFRTIVFLVFGAAVFLSSFLLALYIFHPQHQSIFLGTLHNLKSLESSPDILALRAALQKVAGDLNKHELELQGVFNNLSILSKTESGLDSIDLQTSAAEYREKIAGEISEFKSIEMEFLAAQKVIVDCFDSLKGAPYNANPACLKDATASAVNVRHVVVSLRRQREYLNRILNQQKELLTARLRFV